MIFFDANTPPLESYFPPSVSEAEAEAFILRPRARWANLHRINADTFMLTWSGHDPLQPCWIGTLPELLEVIDENAELSSGPKMPLDPRGGRLIPGRHCTVLAPRFGEAPTLRPTLNAAGFDTFEDL